jgi:hypothetical protein
MDATTLPIIATPAIPADDDHPGRWLGGVIGALASAIVAALAFAIGRATDEDASTVVVVGLLGIPIGFVLGRAALPWVRSGGWSTALGVGALVGLAAPPLGAMEIVLGGGALGAVSGFGGCDVPPMLAAAIVTMYAIPFSFVAVVVTIPAALVWAIATRAVPASWLRHARMPRSIARFGVRHLAMALVVVLVVVALTQIASAAECVR